ncbi:hypothetical protein K450DRAFT_220320 [Umbelopsis ramanniana AG]|uniref:Uncharacterized protein n=1 Tax=Umbelopsis ramanniana AG TaxID=1314678 RepID=A0AAD5HIN2_UMBRA|nr:uncharacterized protein K450DRAFT_220320 [Umbelopsis ramanniana AG]KAI8583861.1 hypothetical protein K450DRAFT_220320 [Umbelopsis ramanniana AG]
MIKNILKEPAMSLNFFYFPISTFCPFFFFISPWLAAQKSLCAHFVRMPSGQEAKATVWFIDDTLKPVGVLIAAGLDAIDPWRKTFRDIYIPNSRHISTCPSRHRIHSRQERKKNHQEKKPKKKIHEKNSLHFFVNTFRTLWPFQCSLAKKKEKDNIKKILPQQSAASSYQNFLSFSLVIIRNQKSYS